MGYMFGTTMRRHNYLGMAESFHMAFGEEVFLSVSAPIEPVLSHMVVSTLYRHKMDVGLIRRRSDHCAFGKMDPEHGGSDDHYRCG